MWELKVIMRLEQCNVKIPQKQNNDGKKTSVATNWWGNQQLRFLQYHGSLILHITQWSLEGMKYSATLPNSSGTDDSVLFRYYSKFTQIFPMMWSCGVLKQTLNFLVCLSFKRNIIWIIVKINFREPCRPASNWLHYRHSYNILFYMSALTRVWGTRQRWLPNCVTPTSMVVYEHLPSQARVHFTNIMPHYIKKTMLKTCLKRSLWCWLVLGNQLTIKIG